MTERLFGKVREYVLQETELAPCIMRCYRISFNLGSPSVQWRIQPCEVCASTKSSGSRVCNCSAAGSSGQLCSALLCRHVVLCALLLFLFCIQIVATTNDAPGAEDQKRIPPKIL